MAQMSFDNYDKNSPWWWKRLESALLFLISGAIPIVGLSTSLDKNIRQDIAMVVLPMLILIVKTIGIFMGESINTDIFKLDKLDKPVD